MDTTESIVSDNAGTRARTPSWYVALALDTLDPRAGAVRISLAGADTLIAGRGPTRTLTREGSQIRLEREDRFWSKEHFRLVREGGSWTLADLGSKNGTRCGGRRVDGTVPLHDGDVIEAGGAFLVIRCTTARVADRTVAPEPGAMLRTLHAALDAELELLARLAPSRLPVLVRGESGSGKEVAARTIHALSKRRGPLVAVNCGALPAALAEAELFGARRGAFSGAVEDRPGLVRSAENGTLFLDEIADLPLPAQAALLRFVQEGEVRALGANQTTQVDVRVIAATHRDLDALVASGAFRHDLAARLRGHVLAMPALRDRREDLGVIASELLHDIAGATAPALDRTAARVLFAHAWPGNVRELAHALRFAAAHAEGGEITDDDLPESVRTPAANPPAPTASGDDRSRLAALLAEHAGNISAVARALETSRSQVRRLMERYGLT